jgi:transposase
MSTRKRYSPQYKQEAVDMVRRSGLSSRKVALEIGLNPGLLAQWVRAAGRGGKVFTGPGVPRDEEVANLKRELARVTKERDFLKEAAAFFAKGSSTGTR